MSHDDLPVNRSGNRPFDDVLQKRLARRTVLAGGVAVAASSFLAASPAAATVRSVAGSPRLDRAGRGGGRSPLIDFEAIPLGFGPTPANSPDYRFSVLAPSGTPLSDGAPEFSYPPTSAADQERQVGIGHDGMWFFPLDRGRQGNRHGLLALNHEFGTNAHVFGKAVLDSLEEVRISQAAHGISVIEIRERRFGEWEVVRSPRSRRITVNTPIDYSGPAAGSELLATSAGNAPAGTLNNCANGYTPWGTYLTCEENFFNGYFGATGDCTATEAQARYGFTDIGFEYGWHNFDPRFDLSNADYRNEENRFGWVVEIDPFRPDRRAVKRTALGRVKHEGAALTIGRGGRAVVYMGDDQRFDYIYKFVSSRNYRSMLARGQSPLDDGQLFVARFDDDGTGQWLELTIDNPDLAAAFSSQAEIVTYARMAADILGATPMDRPEWTTVAANGDVFCTLTNNSRRTEPDAANPEAPTSGDTSSAGAMKTVMWVPRSSGTSSSWPARPSGPRTGSDRPTGSGPTPTDGCSSRPMVRNPTAPTTRCWWPTPRRASCAACSPGSTGAR